MRIGEIKKKIYTLTSEEREILHKMYSLLEDFRTDDDLSDQIQGKACANIGDALDIIDSILSFDGVELEFE